MAVRVDDMQLSNIIESALQSTDPLMKKTLDREWNIRKRTAEETTQILEKTSEYLEKDSDAVDLDPEQFQINILQQADVDLELIGRLNTVLKEYTSGGAKSCEFQLKYNKIEETLKGAKIFLKDHFISLFYDQIIPEGYAFKTSQSEIPHLGVNPNTIYGSSKATFLKGAIFETLNVLGKDVSTMGLMGQDRTGKWMDNTALAHWVPLPEDLDLFKLDKDFQKFTFLYNGRKAIWFPHSGYTFGGDNRAKRCGEKPYAPEDCSSELEILCGLKQAFTTVDQLYHYRTELKKGFVDPNWFKREAAKLMEQKFETVQISDPQKNIREGQIFAFRRFNLSNDPKKENTVGSSGHTGVILGFKSDAAKSKVVIYNDARDMPNIEGRGISEYSLTFAEQEVMIFNYKSNKV